MSISPYKMVYGKSCHLPLELEHKAYWAIKELNYDFNLAGEKRLFDNQMNGETKLMKMPNYVKKKLKDGMTKESKSGNSKLANMFYCTILVLDFLQENFSPNGKDHISTKRFTALELSK